MKTRFLFPHQLRPVGWLLAIPGFVLGYLSVYRDFHISGFGYTVKSTSIYVKGSFYHDFTNTLALTLVIVGLFLAAFSREKKEDELTARMRYNALYWAVLVNYLVYLVWLIVTISIEALKLDKDPLGGATDIFNMSVYNLFTPLVIFIARYYYLRYSKKGEYQTGKMYYLPGKPYRFIGQLTSIPMTIIVFFAFFGSLVFKGGDPEPKDWVEILFLFLPVTLLMWGYSKRDSEDEFVSSLRLESMQLAVYINYTVLLLANFFFYGIDFLEIMFLNLGTIALFFVIRFSYVLSRHSKQNGKELAI
ncbi:MAG: hypothetical protein JSU01_07405 [Bacteroidetes bacterium]|nr:hypothetical protein [Bacteroidota bacterium]